MNFVAGKNKNIKEYEMKGKFSVVGKFNTWQFNFQFDLEADKYNEQSLYLLKENGMNFEKLKKNGINQILIQSRTAWIFHQTNP